MPRKIPAQPIVSPDCPDIGRLLCQYLKKQRITKTALAQKLDVDTASAVRMLQRESIQTDVLWRVCHALGYSFFAELAAMLPAEYESEATAQMRAELEAVKKERDLLKGMLMGR